MIAAPPTWTTHRRHGALLLRSRDGALAVSYREALRPRVELDEALARTLAEIPAAIEHVSPAAPLVTHEGEYAALVLASTRETNHAIGFVFADDYYACLHGVTRVADRAADLAKHVHDLALADAHMLGTRRRRYRYTPPVGWTPEACGFEMTWCTEGAAITVQPAWPASVAASQLVSSEPSDVITAQDGLAGIVYDVSVGGIQRTVAVLQDERYVYPLRLDARSREHRATFLEVVRSIRPHPGGEARRAAAAASLFAHAVE